MRLASPYPTATPEVEELAGDAQPLVRVEPTYPSQAKRRGIEGWVEIEFTITPKGTVEAARVVDRAPSAIFDEAALGAVRRWRYNPRMRDGLAVSQPGVRVRINFLLPSEVEIEPEGELL